MKKGILNNKIIFFVIIGEIYSPVYSQRFSPDNITSVSWFDDSFISNTVPFNPPRRITETQNWVVTQRDLRSVYYGKFPSEIKLRQKYWIKIILKKFSNVDFDANKWNCRLPMGERSVRKEIIRNQECYSFIFFDWLILLFVGHIKSYES